MMDFIINPHIHLFEDRMDNKKSPLVKKESNYNLTQIERTANLLKAISNPYRLKILQLLSKKVQLNVFEIGQILKCTQPNVSYHLIKMKDLRILKSNKVGKEMNYYIADDKLIEMLNIISK